MTDRVLSRPSVLLVALLVASAALVTISVSASRADSHPLPGADSIVFEIEPGNNRLVYGASEQLLVAGSSNCKLTGPSLAGPIMTISATSTDKKGNPVDLSPVGLVDNGLGTSEKGVGNGQDCGLVDQGETISFALNSRIGSRLIESMSLNLEGKFGGGALVQYYLGVTKQGEDHLSLTDKGSDSGPDAREGDDYWFPELPRANFPAKGVLVPVFLFDRVVIQPDTGLGDAGSLSVQSGADFPVPGDFRTVFNLVPVLDCGDDLETGGPDLADNPLAHFVLGPTKVAGPCAVPVELTTTTEEVTPEGEDPYSEQIVNLAPPEGYSWAGIGVSGLLTIQWDVEEPDGDPIDRTLVRTSGGDIVIPWCESVVGYSPSGDGWSYVLNPVIRYPDATEVGLCLVDQSTATVWFDQNPDPEIDDLVVRTQTTEIYYIYEDPMLVRN